MNVFYENFGLRPFQVEKNKIKNRVYYSLKNSKSKNLTLDFE